MKRLEKFFLVLLFVLAFFLRAYKLGENPANFQRQEVFTGYNAYSLLKTGKDINGKRWPLFFQYFERENERFFPVYLYVTIPSVALFGLNEFAVRFPSAFFGTLTVLLTFFLTKELFKKSAISYPLSAISSFLLAISPWHLHFSRQASPSNLSLFFIVSGVYFAVREWPTSIGVKRTRNKVGGTNPQSLRWGMLYLFLKNRQKLSITAFFLSLFTYPRHWLFVILLSFVLFFWEKRKKESRKLWFLWGCSSIILCLVLLKISAKTGELIFSSVFFDEYLGDWSLLERILKVLENYFYYFSFEFLFFSGDTYINHSVGEMGELYLSTLPLFLVGLYQIFQQKLKGKSLLFAWWFLSFLESSLHRSSPDSEKSLVAAVPLMVLTALGLITVSSWLTRIKRGFLRFTVYGLLLAIIAYDLLTYFHIYWVHYFKRTKAEGEAAFKPMLEVVKEKELLYDRILITNDIDGAALFTLFYLSYPPKRFLEERGTRFAFGKFYFDKIPQPGEKEKTLMVTSTSRRAPSGFTKLQEIKLLSQEPVFILWEN